MTKKQAERYHWLLTALENHGITAAETDTLLKCERTLHRWSELECGNSNDYGAWAIERDPMTEKPFMVHHRYIRQKVEITDKNEMKPDEIEALKHGAKIMRNVTTTSTTRRPVADREAGSLKRAQAIAQAHGLTIYHQGDPRGCSLYILRPGDVPEGKDPGAYYNRGLAICID